MKQNVGNVDRLVRIVVGLGLVLWGISSGSWLGAIGIVPLFTGLTRWCPAYCPFGISTNCDSNSCCGGGSCKSKDQPQ